MTTKQSIRAKVPERKIIAIAAPATIKAGEGEGDQKTPPTFDVTAYNGGAVEVALWDLPIVIDLSGLQFSRNVVANLDHNSRQRVGHVTDKSKADGAVKLSGVFSAATPFRDEVVQSAKDGFEWEASVEVTPTKVVEVAAGKKVTVNGQEFTGPLYVARKGTLSGFAFVSHGADPTTDVKIAAGAASHKEKEMDEKLRAFIEAKLPGVDVDSLGDEAIANLRDDFEGKSGKRSVKPAAKSNPFEERKLEAKRREEIRQYADLVIERRNGNITEEEIEAIQRMHDHAIEAGMSPLEFRVEIQEAAIPQGHTVFAPRPREQAITNAVLEAALCMGGNMPAAKLDEYFDDKTLQMAKDRFRGGVGIKQIYRIAARANGHHYDGDDVTLEMQRAAFQKPSRAIHAAGGFGNYDLTSVLANVANKFLLEGWGQGEMVWRAITDIVSVRDFKQASFFKLAGNMKYRKVKPGGQLEHGDVATDSYTVQNETYGILFGIDRTAIINDDLGVITRIPLELGYGANDAFNDVFWTEFLDNVPFFSSEHNNTASGTITASTVLATLAATELVFLNQTKPNGTPLGILPTVWLVPPGSKRIALNAINSTTVTGGSSTVPSVTTFANEYNVVCSAYIANAAYSGSSTTKHYLLCNRPGFSTMLTSFLNGRQNPVVETADAMFNELGVQMRAYHDFGTNKMEYRAGVQGSGA